MENSNQVAGSGLLFLLRQKYKLLRGHAETFYNFPCSGTNLALLCNAENMLEGKLASEELIKIMR